MPFIVDTPEKLMMSLQMCKTNHRLGLPPPTLEELAFTWYQHNPMPIPPMPVLIKK